MGHMHPRELRISLFYLAFFVNRTFILRFSYGHCDTFEANSLPVFRRRLKTHLFTVAFENSG